MYEYVVEMKGISKSFPGTKALDDVAKSTLMNILTGQISMDIGEIFMEGKPVRFSSPKDALKKSIVLVPQELNLVPELSIAENIFLGNEILKIRLIDWKSTCKEAEKLLELLGVHVDVTQPVKKLSAAYQQLVSIARALAYSPKLLI